MYISKEEIRHLLNWKKFIVNFDVEILPSSFLDFYYHENLLERDVFNIRGKGRMGKWNYIDHLLKCKSNLIAFEEPESEWILF